MNDPSQPPPPEESRRFGQAFLIMFWAIVLGLVAMYFNSVLERQHNPNQAVAGRIEAGFREVVLERNRQGHYLARAEINGHPVTVMVDTGATDVAVPADLARRIGLPRLGAVQISTANGVVRGETTRIANFRLGTIEMENVRGTIAPNMPGGQVLLGMSVLRELEMSQVDRTLTLRQHR